MQQAQHHGPLPVPQAYAALNFSNFLEAWTELETLYERRDASENARLKMFLQQRIDRTHAMLDTRGQLLQPLLATTKAREALVDRA